jgi:hypothetical protein
MRALVVVLLLLLAGPAFAEDTLKPGDTITGKLRFFQSQHPNGTTWIKVYQIASDNPRTFAAKDEFCPDHPPKTFHLVVSDKAAEARLKRSLRKKISIVADDFFCSQTAWHVGDAVVMMWRFADKP